MQRLKAGSWTPKSFCVSEPRGKCHTPGKDERRGCPRRQPGWGGPWPHDSAGPSRWGAEHDCAAQSNTSCNLGLDYSGTFVPTPSYGQQHELVEKPSTETTSKFCCEVHVTLRQQSWPYMLAVVSMSSIFPVDPLILHLSPSYYVLAVASVPHPFNWVICFHVEKTMTHLGPKSASRDSTANQQSPQGCQNPKSTKAHMKIQCSGPA